MLREDILLPALSGARSIGVYCVEQGRWNEGRKEFESKGSFAQPMLRSKLMERADQHQVWDAVARSAREAAPATPSPTQSYQALYDDGKIQAHIGEVERAASLRPPVTAHGAAVFIGSTTPGVDLFHSPSLFTREWPKLLRAHALEAYGKALAPDASEVQRRAQVQDLLTQASRAEGSLREMPGSASSSSSAWVRAAAPPSSSRAAPFTLPFSSGAPWCRRRGTKVGRGLGRLHAQQLDLEDEGGARRNDAARSPLAVAQMGGDDELALSPTFMVPTPSSHPLMTRPLPMGNVSGSPRSTELSNFWPLLSHPV